MFFLLPKFINLYFAVSRFSVLFYHFKVFYSKIQIILKPFTEIQFVLIHEGLDVVY